MSITYTDPDSGSSSSLKVTLPDNVFKELSDYAEANSVTKSDVIRESLRDRMNNDLQWKSRRFLFKKTNPYNPDDTKEILKSSSKGTLVKIVAYHQDTPSLAQGLVCYLVRYDDSHVYIEVPNQYPSTTFLNNDTSDVSMCHGFLSVPEKIDLPNTGWGVPQYSLIYKLPFEFIWDIDKNRNPYPALPIAPPPLTW